MSSAADSKSDSDSAARILLIGAPGSGKRTQAQRIQEKYGVCNVGLGALFWNQAIKCSRSKAQREGFFPQESDANGLSQTKFSPREKEFCSVLKEGGKFSDELIVDLICERLESEACLSKGYVLHDVPRNIEQSVWLKRKLMAKEISPKNVIHLDTSGWGDQELDFLKDRLKGRLIHPTSGRSYHMESAPPLEALKDNVSFTARNFYT